MRARPLATSLTAAVVAALLVIGPWTGPAEAAPERRTPVPVAAVSGLPSPRLDQDTTQTVTARGASRDRAVSVSWGDGSALTSGRTACTAQRAAKSPAACAVSLVHEYDGTGVFPVVVKWGPRVIARTTITVRPAPKPWNAPAGWVQPAGWDFFRGGATFVPCSQVDWYYDRAAQPAAAVGMHDEVVGALAKLSAETGLVFVETADPARADLTYSWSDLRSQNGAAAGVGGRRSGRAYATFSTTHWWPTDQWPGYGVVVQPDGSSAIGRGWLVVHETMHALGMDHVNDETQIMNATAGAVNALGAGDLDGLHTMYLNNPCPV